MLKLNLFPWENNEKPYYVNPEGLSWYIDEGLTKYCIRETLNNLKPLNAVVFYVTRAEQDKVNAISRVLVDIKTNKIIEEDTNLEAMACKIDKRRLALSL